MKKKGRLIALVLLSVNVFICPNSVTAQGSRGYPSMYVKKAMGIQLEKNYTLPNSKYDRLSKYLGTKKETLSIFLTADAFISMITYFKNVLNPTYIRVVIGSYSDGGPDVPKGWENQLCIMFRPEDKDEKSLGNFTIIDHSSNFQPISESRAAEWEGNYTDGQKMKILVENIPNTGDNLYEDSVLSDTRSIKYLQNDFDQLLWEIRFQRDTLSVPFSGIKAFFASYDDEGEPIGGKYKNRLLLQFEFTKKVGKSDRVFYIEDIPRPNPVKGLKKNLQPESLLKDLSIEKMYSVDNGQLCPTYCPNH